MGDLVELFGGPVARLYRRSLEDQGFEVLMITVFDIAARQGYAVARRIVKDLAAVFNVARDLGVIVGGIAIGEGQEGRHE